MRIRNSDDTPVSEILSQMGESRPLPMGREEFEIWSERILSGSMVPADMKSQKYVLCNTLLQLGPTESHKPDAFFIHTLRKIAVNQVADTIRKELYAEIKAKEDAAKTPDQKAQELAGEATLHRIEDARKQ